MTITYRFDDWTIAGTMRHGVPDSFDAASLIAQKYMSQNHCIAVAQVSDGVVERTIRRTTAWMKNN
jgi:hypothetical protein